MRRLGGFSVVVYGKGLYIVSDEDLNDERSLAPIEGTRVAGTHHLGRIEPKLAEAFEAALDR